MDANGYVSGHGVEMQVPETPGSERVGHGDAAESMRGSEAGAEGVG